MTPHIIAEIGSMHCGSLPLALAHIQAAAEAGATGCKFQLFRATTLDARPEMQEKLKPYELPLEWIPTLRKEAYAHNLVFGVTPFAVDLVERLRGQINFVKISAYDLTYDALITAATTLGVPVVLSTAMGTIWEIQHAARLCEQADIPFTILHGVAAYPAEVDDYSLAWLRHWKSRVYRVGLSDHTKSPRLAALAVSAGAEMIEKHFRLDNKDAARFIDINIYNACPDRLVASPPSQFRLMVEHIRELPAASLREGPLDCERPLYETCRRTNARPLRGME